MHDLRILTKNWFGKELVSPDDWEDIVSIVDPKISVSAKVFTDEENANTFWGCINISVSHKYLKNSGPEPSFQLRICQGEEGLDLYIDQIQLLKEKQQQGIGTELITQIIRWSRLHNIVRVIANANYNSDSIGYYFFPRLGFDAEIKNAVPIPKKIRGQIPDYSRIEKHQSIKLSHLMELKTGREWWLENGETITVIFYPQDNKFLHRLNTYLAHKNVPPIHDVSSANA